MKHLPIVVSLRVIYLPYFIMKSSHTNEDFLMSKITCLGDKRVMLDCDVAEMMETTTSDILEAVGNNVMRFQNSDIILLEESRWQRKLMETERFAKVPKSKLPVFAFTADGMITLATVLKSTRAHALCRMLVKTYSAVVDLRYLLQNMSIVDDSGMQETMLRESSRLMNELFGISEQDGTSSISFKFRKHIPNQPLASEGYFKLAEENARLQCELEEANKRIEEINTRFFREKGVS